MIILITLIATTISGILYRLGGSAKNGDWWDWMKHSKTRDWGCTIVALGALALIGKTIAWYYYIPTFVACWLALTTYWDDLFNQDCYIMHLAVVGVTFLLFAVFTGCWVGFVLRVATMALFGLLSHLIDETAIPYKDVASENVRGWSIAVTLPLLLI